MGLFGPFLRGIAKHGIVESNGVDFVMFQMTGSAKRWWKDHVRTKPASSPPHTWDQFSQLFMEKFIPFTLRDEYLKKFERLQQGSMTVTQYETRFVDLARHSVILFSMERERVRRFINGLTFSIRLRMAKHIGDDISFQRAEEIARRIEMLSGQDRWWHLRRGLVIFVVAVVPRLEVGVHLVEALLPV
ncbi:uncharacterized protein [Nicotiana tomentosiformis]|uniref:uncharacterized protein n=1 Tax=Nicotiana tomentosiformis TaxID=4098 RepID=UPI00388CE3B6